MHTFLITMTLQTTFLDMNITSIQITGELLHPKHPPTARLTPRRSYLSLQRHMNEAVLPVNGTSVLKGYISSEQMKTL